MEDDKRKELVPLPPDPAAGKGGDEGGAGEFREKADAALDYARDKAEKLLDDVKLRKRIHDAKTECAGLVRSVGRATRKFLADHTAIDPLLVSLLADIDAVTGRLERLEAAEREAASEMPREGFFDRLKQGAARAAGIAKYTLEKSLLERDREAAERALGECFSINADRFSDLVEASPAIAQEVTALRTCEKRLVALEAELAAHESGAAAPPKA